MKEITSKIKFVSFAVILIILIIIVRIIFLQGSYFIDTLNGKHMVASKSVNFRHRILDRNGNILAISMPVYEYHVNPSFIIDLPIVIDKIMKIFPDLNREKLTERLGSGANGWFIIKKKISEQEKQKIISSGIEGSFFLEYYARFYPYENLFSHIVGYTRNSGKYDFGAKGIEQSMNDELLKNDVFLSLDATIQSVVQEELKKTFEKFQPKGAFAILIDLQTRQIIAMVSLPNFNPMGSIDPKSREHVNIPFSSVYNLGSVFKIFTVALGIENGFRVDQKIELPHSIPVTSTFSVTDEHRSLDAMTPEEILTYSSNVGVSYITQKVGFEKQRDFFQKLGILSQPSIEISNAEIADPLYLKSKWKDSMHYTASYGYGVLISPIHFIQTASSLVYDGKVRPLTLLRDKKIEDSSQIILSQQNVVNIQQMLRSVVEKGTARRATINGYSICGKTGTALKFNGQIRKWDNKRKFLSFFSIFPCNEPKYAMYIGIDEPSSGNLAFLQASNTVVETTANVIRIVAPILNAKPDKNPIITQSSANENV